MNKDHRIWFNHWDLRDPVYHTFQFEFNGYQYVTVNGVETCNTRTFQVNQPVKDVLTTDNPQYDIKKFIYENIIDKNNPDEDYVVDVYIGCMAQPFYSTNTDKILNFLSEGVKSGIVDQIPKRIII